MSMRRKFKKEFDHSFSAKKSDRDFLNAMDQTGERNFFTESRSPSAKPKKYRNIPRRLAIGIPAGILAAIILVPSIFIIAISIRIKTNNESMRINYSLMQRRVAEEETFKALNRIEYESTPFDLQKTTDEYTNLVNDFAYEISKEIDFSQSNTLFSPLSCYLVNDLYSHAGDDNAKAIYETALGSEQEREDNFSKVLKTNFFVSEDASTQLYHGAFFRNDLNLYQSYIDFLTARKVEAFKSSFETDKERIANWVNSRIGSNMIKAQDLETTDETNLLLFSLLYFRSKWGIPFVKENTMEDDFHLPSGEVRKTKFMTHTINLISYRYPYAGIYKYDGYLSCYDYYKNGYTIQYLVPLDVKDNIFDLLQGVNFFVEDESAFYSKELADKQHSFSASISVPKFEYTCGYDLTESLKRTALGPLFEHRSDNHVLGRAIDSDAERNNGSGLEKAKQFASVTFDEDGTTVRSVYFQSAFGAGSAYHGGIFTIRLDQPFVYVIRDPNGLPMFVGSYVNPN